ncbi:MAG: cytochrome c1 [Alphaproteobacteria bacterium]|nr:cytochrome c1 [Alphaproteobacteria bacterium]
MMSRSFIGLVFLIAALALPALASENAQHPHAPPSGWPHHGVAGTYDRAALQRGFQVYKQVCATCHSMKHLAYRHLAEIGFNEAEVKALAAEYNVTDGPNDEGEMFQRPARPSDFFVKPYPNDQAARAANNGALPPDLSLIIKGREGHEDYIYSLLTGYGQTPPAEEKIAQGMSYNPYFAGHQIAMPSPLVEGAVTYADGTAASVEQMSKDVTQFLTWAGEPRMEIRKQTGIKTLLFLVVFAGVSYGVKRRIWKKLR